ncbi:MAG: ribonuclease 3 [Patescibacteria group bacterium]|nr:MAG: ribonuclease 3 [Patescibacteria group bacterium]
MKLPSFNNQELLETALTHRSALNEKNTTAAVSNERLEFLGDAVLELATTRFLYDRYPEDPEGTLTAYRSALVKTVTLGKVATELGLGEKLHMSKGEEATGGRSNNGILADTLEAFLGALYLDQGFDAAAKLLAEILFPHIDEIIEKKLYKDAKSYLQEVVQALGFETPTYEVITEVGPDHDKEFTVTVSVGNSVVGRGSGKSKQHAQQAAAREAVKKYTQE